MPELPEILSTPTDSAETPFRRRLLSTDPSDVCRLVWAMAVPWMVLVGLWLLDITGRLDIADQGLGTGLVKGLTLLAVTATLWVAGLAMASLLRPERREWGGWLLALLAVGIVIGFMGLEFEVGQGYYTDEGHYLHRAQLTNSGQVFHRSMIYPHLLYYRDGFGLWLAEHVPGPVRWLAEGIYGVDDEAAIPWLVLRWLTAALGVSTLIPVFLLARRLAGLWAGLAAGLLIIFSLQFHEGFHINICDGPSAVFAAWAFYVVGLLAERETWRRYLWAGVLAALAAASKYPAGVVATAIVGVWVVWRWRRWRRGESVWHGGLLASGGVSLATFLLLNLSLLVYPEATLYGDRGLFFGLRQYGQGGWIGVMPTSNGAYYWQQLRLNFGTAIFPAALVGLLGLRSEARRGLLVLATFPVSYWWLICSMNMVVVRNLFPLLPPLAVFLGVAVSGLAPLATRFLAPRRAWGVAIALTLLVILPTAWRTTRQAVAMTQPGTRQVMSEWMRQHVPRGASLLKESYTPNFPKVWFPNHELRFLIRFPEEALSNVATDYALLASQAHGRFFRPEHQTEMQAQWYRDFFDAHEKVFAVAPGTLRLGPRLLLYRLRHDLDPPPDVTLPAVQAFLPNPNMEEGAQRVFRRDGQFALFKLPRPAGTQRVEVQGQDIAGHLLVRGMDNQELVQVDFENGRAEVTLPTTDKYFFYLYLHQGSRVEAVRWSNIGSRDGV